jgi:hypothetical protein
MSGSSTTGMDRQGLDDAFAANEVRKSNLILEGQMLEAQQRMDEAALRFAQAAEQEELLAEKCLELGLTVKAVLHRSSAAGCWARAGNLYRAIQLCDDLLHRVDLPEGLRQQIQSYALALRGRRVQWLAGLALLAIPSGAWSPA